MYTHIMLCTQHYIRTTYFFSSSFPLCPSLSYCTSVFAFIAAACDGYTYIVYYGSLLQKSLLTRHKQEIRAIVDDDDDEPMGFRMFASRYIILYILLSRSPPAHPFVGFSRVFLTRTAPRSAGSRRRSWKSRRRKRKKKKL